MAALAALPPVQTALETYLGFLDTSDSTTTEKESSVTPNIDRILRDRRQQRQAGDVEEGAASSISGGIGGGRQRRTREKGGGATSSSIREVRGRSRADYELRLIELEKQLSGLLQRHKNAQRKLPNPPHQPTMEDEQLSSTSSSCSAGSHDESYDEDPPPPLRESLQPSHLSKPQTEQDNKMATQSSTKSTRQKRAISEDKIRAPRIRKMVGGNRRTVTEKKVAGEQWDKNGRRRREVDVKRDQRNVLIVNETKKGGGGGNKGGGGGGLRGERESETRERRVGSMEQVTSIQKDHEVKAQLVQETKKQLEIKQNCTQLKMVAQQLEEERERREKAEKAANTLVEHVRSLQTQLGESKRERELAVVRLSKLDIELKKERERGVTREEEEKKMQASLTVVQKEVELVKEKVAEKERKLREKEEEIRQKDIEHKTEKLELLGRVRGAELDLSGQQRETEILQNSLTEMKRQLQQMQELLATRERDHLRDIENCKPLGGREVQEMVRSQVEEERKKMEEIVGQHRQRLEEQQKAYKSLEDEFRMALRIEASRYQELRGKYETVQAQLEGYQSTAESATKKEQKATQMVAELSAIVREQRGRLSELSRVRQDTTAELKERLSELEVEVREKHKLEVKMESLLEDNSSLSSQLTAQQSVLEGLRGERELWSRELAQQGAELAQDRGRMEAQIEALTNETNSLKEDLQNARDAVRVKEKIMTDQQNSISQLKETLAGREREEEEARQDWENEQQSLHIQLEQEQESSTQLQDELTKALERKIQLKEELAAVKDELTNCQQKYGKLRGEWDERVKVIAGLEETLSQVQTTFSERETALSREKNEAVERAASVEERLREREVSHQHQLEAQKASRDSHMTKLVRKKDKEIEAANQKVRDVEGEMREILVEVAKEKRAMEARSQRLSLALNQLQQDFNQ